MGDHYVPRYYLKGFSRDGKRIWAFDKDERRAFPTQIKSIANETGLYPPELESLLANEVEGPANEVLKAIRRGERITQSDKSVLSAYMVCLLKRVPNTREWVREQAPGMLEEIIENTSRRLDELERQEPEREELWKRRRLELAQLPEGFVEDLARMGFLKQVMPDTAPKVVAMLSRMTWQFRTTHKPALLTSDNPLFFHRGLGIAHQQAEMSFPISSEIALWATWRADLDDAYAPMNDSWIKELNRRTASSATRYAFHVADEDWILRLLCKKNWRINVLR